MKPKVVLVRFSENAQMLEPVTLVSGPSVDGFVTIDRPLPSPDGPTNQWHVSRVYAFDEQLMAKVNGLAYSAVDAASAALQILNTEGKILFHNEAINASIIEQYGSLDDATKH